MKARDGREAVLRRGIELVGLMHENGVGLLAGSDSGPRPESVPYPTPEPGADLHEELALLDRDPLADIRNTRAIVAVVVRGRLLEGAAFER